jgi:hypothetical protein
MECQTHEETQRQAFCECQVHILLGRGRTAAGVILPTFFAVASSLLHPKAKIVISARALQFLNASNCMAFNSQSSQSPYEIMHFYLLSWSVVSHNPFHFVTKHPLFPCDPDPVPSCKAKAWLVLRPKAFTLIFWPVSYSLNWKKNVHGCTNTINPPKSQSPSSPLFFSHYPIPENSLFNLYSSLEISSNISLIG